MPIQPHDVEESEEDVKVRFITPALQAKGWIARENFRMEFPITDGQIVVNGRAAEHRNPRRADYYLYQAIRNRYSATRNSGGEYY